MKMNDFICSCFGIDGEVIDGLCDEFDIDFDDEDVFKAFSFFNKGNENGWAVAQELLCISFEKIIEKYGLEGSETDYDFTSPSYPDFYYKGQKFDTKEGLEELLED